jgi:hypothetical protein
VPRQVFRFAVTVPAGTLQSAPQVTALALPERIVRRVRVRIPPGPRGNVGYQFTSGGLQVIPETVGSFEIADGEAIEYDLEGYLTTGAWQLTAYNLGTFPHTLGIRFDCDPITASNADLAFQPLPIS